MSAQTTRGSKGPRGAYSRLICLGCRKRRIRCELPSDSAIPDPGELQTAKTPCYRCKRLGIRCVIRQTILGRPNHEKSPTIPSDLQLVRTDDAVPRIVIELHSAPIDCTQPFPIQDEAYIANSSAPWTGMHSSSNLLPNHRNPICWTRNTLLIHSPQSPETTIIIHAVDTLRRERVENEWFRHLPAYVGHSPALDLSIKALVAACAYARGVPKLTSRDCYQALALALDSVHARISQCRGKLDDDILAATALLAPFEGVLRKHGNPTRLHVEGLAAILKSRPKTYPVTQLARDVFNFHVCDSALMACVQGIPSPFESVPRGYFTNNRIGCGDSDQAQLKAFGSELFVRMPRLVDLTRLLRVQGSPQHQFFADALRLSTSLLELEDVQAETRLLRNVEVYPSTSGDSEDTLPFGLGFQFASVEEFEALMYYWQNRLHLSRLVQRLRDLSTSSGIQFNMAGKPNVSFLSPSSGLETKEMIRLAKNILMCAEYTDTLPLRKHHRLYVHAMVTVWGVIMDVPGVLCQMQDGERKDPLLTRLLRRVNMSLTAKLDLNCEDIDIAADVFVGGPLEGRFVEVYGL